MIFYLSIFIGGGLFGWMIDTLYRTQDEKRYSPNTFFPFFSIIYGYAAVLLYILFNFLQAPFVYHIIIGTIISTGLELISGTLALTFLNKRFWDYRNSRFNFYGFVDARHVFYWLFLVGIYRAIFPFIF